MTSSCAAAPWASSLRLPCSSRATGEHSNPCCQVCGSMIWLSGTRIHRQAASSSARHRPEHRHAERAGFSLHCCSWRQVEKPSVLVQGGCGGASKAAGQGPGVEHLCQGSHGAGAAPASLCSVRVQSSCCPAGCGRCFVLSRLHLRSVVSREREGGGGACPRRPGSVQYG